MAHIVTEFLAYQVFNIMVARNYLQTLCSKRADPTTSVSPLSLSVKKLLKFVLVYVGMALTVCAALIVTVFSIPLLKLNYVF